jgi:hypothetical protein
MRLFLSLNFSIQLELSVTASSGLVVVAMNARACCFIKSSDSGLPFFSYITVSDKLDGIA